MMSVCGCTRSLPLRLTRSFTTTPVSRRPSLDERPPTPRRKGRTPRVNPKTQSILPPHKLRALVSLYHQSDDFITPENLLDRIDAAFITDAYQPHNTPDRSRHESYEDILKGQRSVPRMSPWNLESVTSSRAPYTADPSSFGSWSGTVPGRERQIVDALYGVDSPRIDAHPLPGYDTLKEARELKQKKKEE